MKTKSCFWFFVSALLFNAPTAQADTLTFFSTNTLVFSDGGTGGVGFVLDTTNNTIPSFGVHTTFGSLLAAAFYGGSVGSSVDTNFPNPAASIFQISTGTFAGDWELHFQADYGTVPGGEGGFFLTLILPNYPSLTEPTSVIFGTDFQIGLGGRAVTGSATVDPQFEVTPILPALPLFASGLGALGLLGWRRKRKNAAAIAAA